MKMKVVYWLSRFSLVAIMGLGMYQQWAGANGAPAIVRLTESLSEEAFSAENLTITHPTILALLSGNRAEVMRVVQRAQCDCYQVELYDFETNRTVTALVDPQQNQLLEQFTLPHSQPAYNQRIAQRAVQLIQSDPDLVASLGRIPDVDAIDLMHVTRAESSCDGNHYCLGATFIADSGNIWVAVDLTTETIADIWWDGRHIAYDQLTDTTEAPRALHRTVPTACPQTNWHIEQTGWTIDYIVEPSDGLHAYNIQFNGVEVATSIKVAQWNTNYPLTTDYADFTGCGGTGGGFPIIAITDEPTIEQLPNGFQIVQLFSMQGWPNPCNYRYAMRYQFFDDGSWRPTVAAYGPGCGNGTTVSEPVYRPILRIDIAPNGDADDSFALWNSTGNWETQASEMWNLQDDDTLYSPQGYLYRVIDGTGNGYYVEPGQGQFGDGGIGDNAYTYATLHHPAEGDADLSSLITPWSGIHPEDHAQGPDQFVDNEQILGQNLVLWYVPQSKAVTTDSPGEEYCWTESETLIWPCYAGPKFIPFLSNPSSVGLVSAETAPPFSLVFVILLLLIVCSLTIVRQLHGKN